MKLLFVLVMLTAEAAGVEDLSGKMFTFPVKNNKAHVRLNTNKESFNAVTVCHRSFTDLTRNHVLFSMSTNSIPNEFLIFWGGALKELEAHIKDQKLKYQGLNYKPYTWHSICTTWDSVSGLVQMWFNGQPLIWKFVISGREMTGTPIIILGQEQDSHGGGFDSTEAFMGMMSDVHMWDYTLSTCEIQKYMDELNFTPGNVLNWRAMDYQITDRVVLEDKIQLCH
ncbi:serum amyloid P-component-like [Gouania willdenowi]|uniref:Pentraxin family member n=1 Tax=Gouania willdenowi TaxID=441366 RepID=A0A8C5EHW1_GOUWI|nr:serum amyloid P-component-like [Gouania willdenowi]